MAETARLTAASRENVTSVGYTTRLTSATPPRALAQTLLLVGQKVAGGTIEPGEPTPVTSIEELERIAGARSELAQMGRSAFLNANGIDIQAYATEAQSSDTPATGTITVVGTSTVAGSVAIYIADQRIAVTIPNASTATIAASAIQAAIAANQRAPVTATASAGIVTLTAAYRGIAGNRIGLAINRNMGDPALPAGLTSIAATGMSGGVATISADIALDESSPVTYIAHTRVNPTELTQLEALEQSRWNATTKRPVILIGAVGGDVTAATAVASTRNSLISCLVSAFGIQEGFPSVAAGVAAIAASQAARNPAVQLFGRRVIGLTQPQSGQEWNFQERDTALRGGVSTLIVRNGQVQVSQLRNTLRTDVGGGPADSSHTYATTIAVLGTVIRDLDDWTQQNYSQALLLSDGERLPQTAGTRIVTPAQKRAALTTRYRQWAALGWVEGAELFDETVRVSRDSVNRNRLVETIPIYVVGNARQFDIQVEFQFNPA